MKTPKTIWIFDVDGVISDPVKKRVTKPQILSFIIKRLEEKEPAAFLTGRAMEWMESRILPELEKSATLDKLYNLYVLAEFGGISIEYKKGGKNKKINSDLNLPKKLKIAASKIAKKYSDSMFIDTSKITHFTVEMKDNFNMKLFKKEQNKLDEELKQLVKDYDKEKTLEVFSDRIATTIKDKKINKRFAIQELLKWLKIRSIKPKEFKVFGDSKSDLEMAEEIIKHNLNVKFVFVGEKEQLEGINFSFPIIFTKNHCDEGTAEYLFNY